MLTFTPRDGVPVETFTANDAVGAVRRLFTNAKFEADRPGGTWMLTSIPHIGDPVEMYVKNSSAQQEEEDEEEGGFVPLTEEELMR